MIIFPAIDIIGGQVVRLTKGDYAQKKTYSEDPTKVAKSFSDFGATHLHVVDLDGAKLGETSNYSVISDIIKSTSMFVEVGGGIRDLKRIENYAKGGVSRVIIGTAAVKDPQFLKDAVKNFGDLIAVGVDTHDGFVATDGWIQKSNISGVDFCKKMRDEGVKNVIYTDISKDGALSGTNLEIYSELSKIEGLDITASGGITYLDEIEKLKQMKVYGAIVGKAIYEGKLNLSEVLLRAEDK